jgi:hypothetical protein
MATMLSVTIDSKVAANAATRRAERTEICAILEQICQEIGATSATSNATLRHRDGSTAAGSWTYTPVAAS